jgi:hypothetical protein
MLRPDAAAVDYFVRTPNSSVEAWFASHDKDAEIVQRVNKDWKARYDAALKAGYTESEIENLLTQDQEKRNGAINHIISTADLATIKSAALIGIVPALGVLAIGEFLGWAMRGFRARPS